MIAKEGAEVFYRGGFSKKIVDFLKRNGGLIDEEDLNEYEPEWVQPLSVNYKNYTLYELPLNCQGLCVLEAIRIVSHFDLRSLNFTLQSIYIT